MDIGGLQKLTLLDYPGRLACTVFLSGCNLRCPFCHNAGLVMPEQIGTPAMSWEEFLAFLRKRSGRLSGVCVTGGEPTLRPDLPGLLRAVKDLGYDVKLDTNGSNPLMLRSVLEAGLVDYVAMDIKNSPGRYVRTCGGVDILAKAKESVSILMGGPVEYEFRTTAVKPFHTPEAMEDIGRWLAGAKTYYIQQFVDSGNLVGSGVEALTKEEMGALLQAVLPWIPGAQLRGVE